MAANVVIDLACSISWQRGADTSGHVFPEFGRHYRVTVR
jgi:hypothetical protein